MRYPQEIYDNSSKFGFKSSNLIFLKEKLFDFQVDSINELHLTIPAFVTLSHDIIIFHLNKFSS